MAAVHAEIKNYDLAMEYYDQGAALAQRLNQTKLLHIILLNVGFIEYDKKKYLQATSNAHIAKRHFSDSNNQVGLADCYYLLAQSHQALGHLDSA